jgi:hypothetical protein
LETKSPLSRSILIKRPLLILAGSDPGLVNG